MRPVVEGQRDTSDSGTQRAREPESHRGAWDNGGKRVAEHAEMIARSAKDRRRDHNDKAGIGAYSGAI